MQFVVSQYVINKPKIENWTTEIIFVENTFWKSNLTPDIFVLRLQRKVTYTADLSNSSIAILVSTSRSQEKIKMPRPAIPEDKVNLRLILVSGKTKDYLFKPTDSAGEIAQYVFDNWPIGERIWT